MNLNGQYRNPDLVILIESFKKNLKNLTNDELNYLEGNLIV